METVNAKNKKEKLSTLLQLFLIEDKNRKWDGKDFSREMFACKKLISNYPDFEFFYFLPEFYNKFNSLLGLISKESIKRLDILYKEWQDKKSINIKLEEKPVIQLESNLQKPNNLLEFLNS